MLTERNVLLTGDQINSTVKVAEALENEPRAVASIDRGRWVVRLLWVGIACSVVGMRLSTAFGWDARDYLSAIRHYEAYIDGNASASLPYSPLFMIPTAGVARLLPLWLTITVFCLAYISGWLVQLRVGMQFANADERKILRYVAPVIAFFPGLLVADTFVSGNMAYILYGLMLASAAWGWKRGRWEWFYLAVLASACVKVQLLTMLAIPLLCGRRQFLKSVGAGTIGLALYALQSRIWPQAFHTYVNTLQRMSQSRRDFGCGPAGNLARALQSFGMSYEKPCTLFYLGYACVLFLVLLSLSRLYREKRVSFESWGPVMLIGVVMLNPRILTYDVAAISLPMALVAWRALRDVSRNRGLVFAGTAVALLCLNIFIGVNEATVVPDEYVEMFLLLGIFACGVRCLLKEAGELSPSGERFGAESFSVESYMSETELPLTLAHQEREL